MNFIVKLIENFDTLMGYEQKEYIIEHPEETLRMLWFLIGYAKRER